MHKAATNSNYGEWDHGINTDQSNCQMRWTRLVSTRTFGYDVWSRLPRASARRKSSPVTFGLSSVASRGCEFTLVGQAQHYHNSLLLGRRAVLDLCDTESNRGQRCVCNRDSWRTAYGKLCARATHAKISLRSYKKTTQFTVGTKLKAKKCCIRDDERIFVHTTYHCLFVCYERMIYVDSDKTIGLIVNPVLATMSTCASMESAL